MLAISTTGAFPLDDDDRRLRFDSAAPARAATASCRQFRVVLYSHDTMGLGHLRRNQLIAIAIRRAVPEAQVLLIAGIQQAACLNFPPGVDCLTLPRLAKSIDGVYGARSLDLPLEQMAALRGASIRATIEAFDPDLFVADKSPRGVCGELDSSLNWLTQRGRALCVLGLRDVLDDPEAVVRDWSLGSCLEAIDRHYDQCWVYGDQSVYDLGAEYEWPSRLCKKLSYLGYLDQQERLADGRDDGSLIRNELSIGDERLAVCTIGGGQDGMSLAAAFASAQMPGEFVGVLLTGPFLPRNDRLEVHRLADRNPRMRIIEFLPEADRLVAHADRLVTMGGYNSVCAALSFRKPTLVAPRVVPRREQWIRAQRLAARGLLDVLAPEQLRPEPIAAWLARPACAAATQGGAVDLAGLERLGAATASLCRTVQASPK